MFLSVSVCVLTAVTMDGWDIQNVIVVMLLCCIFSTECMTFSLFYFMKYSLQSLCKPQCQRFRALASTRHIFRIQKCVPYSYFVFFLYSTLSFLLSLRQARKDFITAKYTEKRFARKKSPDSAPRLHTLCEAVKARDIFSLIQVYAEGVDLMEPIPLANGHVSPGY